MAEGAHKPRPVSGDEAPLNHLVGEGPQFRRDSDPSLLGLRADVRCVLRTHR
jgi:hypothetical protein